MNFTTPLLAGNLPQSTRLLLQQSAHAKKMRNEMSEEDCQLYGNYFNCFSDHLEKNFSSAAAVGLFILKF